MRDKIYAGIVLYNADRKRLSENISAIIDQVDKVLLYDNGSKNTREIEEEIELVKRCKLIKAPKNYGIAHALNSLASLAYHDGAKWLLTLDQDTVVKPGLIETYCKYMNLPYIGQLCCLFEDRNNPEIKWDKHSEVEKIDRTITSAALVNLAAWKAVDGFDESLFIDSVDHEFCTLLLHRGYFNYQINFVGFLHELGHIEKHTLLGHNYFTTNHNAFRRYYMARNSILIARRYHTSVWVEYKWLLSEVAHIILTEKDKRKKILNTLKGVKDGLTTDTTRPIGNAK
ncbi:glycosyltransferase [Lactobacillus delbrueckii]|uniref:glycosyltransferase n=1 Tax=Lactobacillus delbrueckii TaxID=1584 RepID=UPI0006804497|nr:glycosyltransferase [Lactobacillus delbrueckii]APG75360.1 hypothetical protein LS838_08840 [Lactobacillus delbrueckii subsp. sunkii]GHN13172.1 dTDP-rhamnosyl transferase RfbF [Lactobacillus delbrueckii subsp. sunkii]GHN14746.1 dTDP-rhamnosyl transferase RfbF [Lactobacillus delbrueckii subsp. sunkii]